MSSRARRLLAATTVLVVGWTTLWPLVTAVKARLLHEETILCHQAGSMVTPDEAPMPMKPAAETTPGHGEAKTHCPLCIMAFYGSAAQPLAVPPLQFFTLAVRPEVYSAPPPASLEVPLPPSRAPPLPAAA